MKISITITILLFSLQYSCIFKKRNDWCSVPNLLKDTLLFNNPDSTVLIDEKYCESYLDYAICIKGRIQNQNPLGENIRFLGIDHVDSLNNKIEIHLGTISGASEWFNSDSLAENKMFFKYYQYMGNETHKWIYIKDGEVCDTFYIALINM